MKGSFASMTIILYFCVQKGPITPDNLLYTLLFLPKNVLMAVAGNWKNTFFIRKNVFGMASWLFFTSAYLVLTTSSFYVLGTSIFPASRHMPCHFQHGGVAIYLSMAVEWTSKSDIFRDVRFFLAEESNEEVCS